MMYTILKARRKTLGIMSQKHGGSIMLIGCQKELFRQLIRIIGNIGTQASSGIYGTYGLFKKIPPRGNGTLPISETIRV
jgi:hypothetical protein